MKKFLMIVAMCCLTMATAQAQEVFKELLKSAPNQFMFCAPTSIMIMTSVIYCHTTRINTNFDFDFRYN